MFWQYGLFYSILSGCIWGVFWQIFFTVAGILTLGTPLNLELSQIMIIGPLAGIIFIKLNFSIFIINRSKSLLYFVFLDTN